MLPWLLAIPPAFAFCVIVTWVLRPDLHRDRSLRGALIVSVGIAAIEALVGALILGFLLLVSASSVEF